MYHPIKEKNMIDLANYQRSLWNNPRLQYLFFELTDCCNLNCMHCGSRCSGMNKMYLPISAIVKTLKQVAEKYHSREIMVCLTGGEPMLYPDLNKVIALAHDMGFPVGMTSNGTLIDAKAAGELMSAGLDTVSISIDGIGNVHDRFRCSHGSFDRAMNGIRYLERVGASVQPLTVVHKKNFFQLEDMFRLFSAEGLYSWRLTNMDPIGRARRNKDLLLTGDELKKLFSFVREKRFNPNSQMEVTMSCPHFLTYEYEREVRDNYFQCGAGLRIASVMANGDIGACLDIERRPELIQGNVFEDDFIEVWETRFETFRQDRTNQSRTCSTCRHSEVCMGDSAHTWNYGNQEPGYCVAQMLEGN